MHVKVILMVMVRPVLKMTKLCRDVDLCFLQGIFFFLMAMPCGLVAAGLSVPNYEHRVTGRFWTP